MAVGVAAALQRVRPKPAYPALRIGFDVVLVGAAVWTIVVGYSDVLPYPFPGSESATEYVDADVGPATSSS